MMGRKNGRIGILLSLAMIMGLCLLGCGKSQISSVQEKSFETEGEENVSNTAETSDAKSESKGNITSNKFKTDAVIEETVLWDERDIKITASDISYETSSMTLNLIIENSSDKNLSFSSGSMGYSINAINGYMIADGYLSADVAAGKKANESISFSITEMAVYGIMEVADIQVGFDITDDDYNHLYTGPMQIKTSASETYDYAVDTYKDSLKNGNLEKSYDCSVEYFAEDELYSQSDVKVVSEAMLSNTDGEQMLFIEVENNSSEQIYVTTSDIMVNGMVVYSSTWSSDAVNPGGRCILDLSISSILDSAYQEIMGISDIGNFTCTFNVKDADNKKITEPEEISIDIPGKDASFENTGDEVYNEDGIRIISKGLIKDKLEFSPFVHMLLLVENGYSDAVSISDNFDSLSANGTMTDYYGCSADIPSGKSALLDISILADTLEENGIKDVSDITEMEVTFEITDEAHDTIAEPKVTVEY